MTEAEWLRCSDPTAMLEFLRDRGKASERKLRLLACACCRDVWDLLPAGSSRETVEAVERALDGQEVPGPSWETVVPPLLTSLTGRYGPLAARYTAYSRPFFAAHHAAHAAALAAAEEAASAAGSGDQSGATPVRLAGRAGWEAVWNNPANAYTSLSPLRQEAWEAARDAAQVAKQAAQAALLRDIAGPLLFHEVHIDPVWLAWNDGTVRRLAEAAYNERQLPAGTLDVARLAVLADALEEAGCDEAGLLGHLRSEGPHWRGCWALDLLLEKS
jgi:hypothetical protein